MNAKTEKMQTGHSQLSNVITNIWLVVLAVIVGLTVIVTSVLVGWPIVSHLAAKFMG